MTSGFVGLTFAWKPCSQASVSGVSFMTVAVLDQVADRIEPEAVHAAGPSARSRRSGTPRRSLPDCDSSGRACPTRTSRRSAGRRSSATPAGPRGPRVSGTLSGSTKMYQSRYCGSPAQRFLEVRMVRRAVVQHEVDDDADAALVALGEEAPEIVLRAVLRVDAVVIGHVVAVVARRRVDRHEPDPGDAEVASSSRGRRRSGSRASRSGPGSRRCRRSRAVR